MTLNGQTQELQRIIDRQLISTLFQPIVDCQERSVLGYEVLSRGPSDSPLHAAPALFQAGEQCDQVISLERACLGHAWQILQSSPSIFALPVVENDRPLGLLHKWRVDRKSTRLNSSHVRISYAVF